MKNKIMSIIYVLLTFIITTILVSIILLNSDKILKNFSIISVDNYSTKYTVEFEKVKAAKSYSIIIYNDDNSIFYTKNITTTKETINLVNIEYNKKYKMIILAYDNLGDSISVNNPYSFTYTDPTFNKENDLVLSQNTDYNLQIDGKINKKNYMIKLFTNGKEIKKEVLKTNTYTIPKELYKDQTEVINVKIYENLNEINSINLYSNMSPLTDLTITSPQNDATLDYNDVAFTYNGGDNATSYLLQIYKGDDLLKETPISKNRCVISSDFFNKAEKYKIRINALYKDYSNYQKNAEVTFTMNAKDTLKPVYINKYYKYVKEGTSLILNNPNSDGTIYYTTDGSDPSVSGIKYTTPLIINNNLVVKTVIKEKMKNDSIISTFNINVGVKTNYKVYLSPSNQTGNLGASSVGYTNEGTEMNDLSNYIQNRLNEYNVKVYRNNPNGNINIWNSDSIYYGCDLHIAIHSNASDDGTAHGIETWINEQTSETYSLANIIEKDLVDIYYTDDGNRGVKYANGAIGEANDAFVPFGLLVEVAYHDNVNDAKWIMENKKIIGNTIADSILKYFGII